MLLDLKMSLRVVANMFETQTGQEASVTKQKITKFTSPQSVCIKSWLFQNMLTNPALNDS